MLSPDAAGSRQALREVEYAASLNKRFAPIVCRPVEDSAVPEPLRRLNFIFFDDPERFEASADHLVEALRTDIGWIREHTKFGEVAREWVAAGRPNSLLLRPPTLDVAEYWMASRPQGAPEPTDEIRTFLVESRKGARASQRLRRFALGSIFGLMMAVILGLVGWIKQDYLIGQWRYATVTLPYWYAHVRGHVLTAVQERALKPGASFKECAQDCPEMVVIPAGPFLMGKRVSQNHTAEPQHPVTIGKPLAVAKYEVTFADWDACVASGGCNGYKPNDYSLPDAKKVPVFNVNWIDAKAYVAWLSLVTGKNYGLLSEAEYEYAARAGTTTAYPWGDDIGENNADCYFCESEWDNTRPAPVGSYASNRFSLYDMVGNVYEWTEDCWHDNYTNAPKDGSPWLWESGDDCTRRVVRGGSWSTAPDAIVSAERDEYPSDLRSDTLGFRVARTLDTR